MLQLPQALAPLAPYHRFIVCQFVPDQTKPGKTHKFPIDIRTGKMPTKGNGGAGDSSIWTDYDTAARAAMTWGLPTGPGTAGYGVGFYFDASDGFWFIDVDGCIINGSYTPIAAELSAALPGAAVEVSQSGNGLHFIGRGTPPENRKIKDHTGKLFDLYTDDRFVAFGPFGAVGDAATDHTAALHAIVERHLKRDPTVTAAEWSDGPCAEWRGPVDDQMLIARALRSTSLAGAFGGKASFKQLWENDVDALASAYPPDANSNEPYNASSADAALFQHLSFWTGKDCARIKRIAFESALVRQKWHDREDGYVDMSIMGCVARQTTVCVDKPAELPEPTAGSVDGAPMGKLVTGSTILDVNDQLKMFTGCVYVTDAHRILVTGGMTVKPEQFKVLFGGYTCAMDMAGTRTSRDAWEVFTQSQAFRSPRADGTCFKPQLPPGAILSDAGRTRANTYWPVTVPRKAGDASPLLRHLALLLPDPRDQTILLSYMAACVQHQGTKFQWAPFIQGVEGNGKTLLSRCVAEAVGRRYTHWPAASKLGKQFNSWLFGKVFYGVEDVYVPGDRGEIFEELKPMITGEELEIEAKGVDQTSADVCGNFMFNSNHPEGLPKTANDRRIAPFFCAQQKAWHLERDGMGEEYFRKLVGWLKHEDGFAIVAEFLYTYQIPDEFNPASGQRAPTTTSTDAAISASVGTIEQEIQEAIDQAQPGFAGGWVSSIMLDRLLEKINATRRVTRNKRAAMLETLGYVPHPGLPGGRCSVPVSPDAGNPILFVLNGHRSVHLTGAAVGHAYGRAQNPETASVINY